jgi:hypothetical protein
MDLAVIHVRYKASRSQTNIVGGLHHRPATGEIRARGFPVVEMRNLLAEAVDSLTAF